MRVITLVGESGTGKSHHAAVVAKKEKADAIIDDGLLISSNKVLAGKSAKRENTKIASVKRALFSYPDHVAEVKATIKKNNIETILILGTSEEMTNRIAQKLELGEVDKHIHIEEISTPEDIATAKRLRYTYGKHIIPVPTFEIKKDFSGCFLHPLRIFMRRQGRREEFEDKSVVRPTYSYLGDFSISDNAIVQMVVYEAKRCAGVERANASIINHANGEIEINVSLTLSYGINIRSVCSDVSSSVIKQIDRMTALSVCKVNITVKELMTS